MTTEKLKMIDKANILQSACVLFGHEEIGKEKFIEIVARIADGIGNPILAEKAKPAASNQSAEWSEKDETDMKDIIKAVVEVWDKDDANRMIRLLKSLRPQLKQEWSEEEVDKLVQERAKASGTSHSELEFYRHGIIDGVHHFYFQPHWKPSEEQMKALWKMMKNGVHLSAWKELQPNIESLYNDLKKL